MPTILTLFKDVLRKLTPAEVDQNFQNLQTNLDKLGGYTASQAPAANQIPVLTANNTLVLGGGADNGNDKVQVTNGGISLICTDNAGTYNTKAALQALNSGTGAFGAAAGLKIGMGTTLTNYTQIAAVLGVYDNYQGAPNGLGGRLAFFTKATATDAAPVERMRITAAGNLLVGTTAEVAGGGCLQVKSGVTFPAAQVSSSNANTLDDYEEGTWTPVLTGDATAGAGTYSMQEGTYTKVGRLVHVRCRIQWSAHSGAGGFYINGLPYGCVNASALAVWASNLVIGAGKQLSAYASSGLSRITLASIDAAGGAVGTIAVDPAGDIFISGTYEAAT